jgi:hypothetical protein
MTAIERSFEMDLVDAHHECELVGVKGEPVRLAGGLAICLCFCLWPIHRGTLDADHATFCALSELDTTVRRWFPSLGLEWVDNRKGFNGVQARGRVLAAA